jgi:tetratricopeptide (TPR) repeat protein
MLVPVIGLVQVGSQALADRYTYLPLIGVFLGVTFGLAARVRSRIAILIPLTFLVLGGCLLTNMRQLRYWQNSEALFTHTISVTKDNCIAYNNLGDALDSEGYPQKAIEYYREALRLEPHYVAVLNNLAVDLAGTGHTQEAIQHFEAALHLNPDAPGIHYNLGLVLSKNGQVEKAIAQFRMALRLQPDFADARDHLGDALLRSGYALFQNGQIPQAIAPLQEGLQIHPDHVMGRNYLGFAFLRQGQAGPAVANFQNVLELQPENVDASEYLAWVLATCPDASIRNGTRAVELAQRANQLSGGSNPAILATLAAAQAEVGHFPDAMTTAQKALALATAQTNAAVVNALKDQIGFYTTNLPFRDNSLTNIQAPTQ